MLEHSLYSVAEIPWYSHADIRKKHHFQDHIAEKEKISVPGSARVERVIVLKSNVSVVVAL